MKRLRLLVGGIPIPIDQEKPAIDADTNHLSTSDESSVYSNSGGSTYEEDIDNFFDDPFKETLTDSSDESSVYSNSGDSTYEEDRDNFFDDTSKETLTDSSDESSVKLSEAGNSSRRANLSDWEPLSKWRKVEPSVDLDFFESEENIEDEEHAKLYESMIKAIKEDNIKILKNFRYKNLLSVREQFSLVQLSMQLDRKKAFNCLLDHFLTNIDRGSENQVETPLIFAIKENKDYFLKRFFAENVFVNWCYLIKHLNFHTFNDAEKCLALVKHGADINESKRQNETPLRFACRSGDVNQICIFLYIGADLQPMYFAKIPLMELNKTCESWIQDVLLDYTYFESQWISMNLSDLINYSYNPYIFKKIVQKLKNVTFDNYDGWYPRVKTTKFFKKISLEHCELLLSKFPNVAKHLVRYLKSFLSSAHKNPEFLEILGCIQQNSNVFCGKITCYQIKILHRDLSTKSFQKLIYFLSSCGVNLDFEILHFIYTKEKFSQFFIHLLHINRIRYFPSQIKNCPLLSIICDFNLERMNDILLNCKLGMISHKNPCRKHCLGKYVRIRSSIQETLLPSLLELSRNASRKYLVQHYEVKTFGHFMSILNTLGLPKDYINILIFKKELYKC